MPEAPKPTSAGLAAALAAPIAPARLSAFYRVGLLLNAAVMLLLPLVYVAIIAAVGWAVWWHATTNTGILGAGSRRSGRAGIGAFLLYALPIVAGAALILFMIKPIFAPRAKRPKPVSLDPKKQPLLFDLVRALCAKVGAPMPNRIDVDCQVNASAAFRRGLLSFFGHDLLLTIGLPLAAGLTLRQFVGVLAHEFGHFAQGTGMRLSYLVRSVNFWFARVVYERDAWDETLVRWSKESDFRIAIILWAVRFFIWLTRRVLWLLFLLAQAISTFFLRQMEYDADQYEIEIAGSRAFEETAKRLPVLELARQKAFAELGDAWAEKRLGDDLAELVVAELMTIPPKDQDEFLKEHLKGKGSLWDTHPPDTRRIEAAKAAKRDGIFTIDAPASAVFADFHGLSKAASLTFYREQLEDEVTPANLVPTAALLERRGEIEADGQRLERYFQGFFDGRHPPFLPDEAALPVDDVTLAVASLKAVRAEVGPTVAKAKPVLETLEKEQERLTTLARAEVLLRANFKIRPHEFGLKGGTSMEANAEKRRALAKRDEVAAELAPVGAFFVERLALAVRLRQTPAFAATMKSTGVADEDLIVLLSALASLKGALAPLREMLDSFAATQILFDNIEGNEGNEALVSAIKSGVSRWRTGLQAVRSALGEAPYPFSHGKGAGVSLARHIVEKVPGEEDIGAVVGQVAEAADRYFAVLSRVLGRLVTVAEGVEEAVGLPALPKPGGSET